LGMIGPVTIISESSIGSNTRRIEAATGLGSLALLKDRHLLLERAAEMLRVDPDGVVDALERLLERQRAGERELQRLKSQSLEADAAELVNRRVDGVVVARRDGLTPDQLRELVQSVRQRGELRAVVVGGSPDGTKVAIAASTSGEVNAGDLVKRAASVVGGGGGGTPDLAVAGGRDLTRLEEALDTAAHVLGVPGARSSGSSPPESDGGSRGSDGGPV
ncbi:MAG TPA: DHHA1 domain-containing protein, partial [Acidimicrobiales bacterium]|nr:DHHA1 domain-containing protein [Acidimicrobiales bacterium]